MLLLFSTTALSAAQLSSGAFGSVIPSAIYDVVLAVLVGPLAMAFVLRRQAVERPDW